jgi:hypothetical protein
MRPSPAHQNYEDGMIHNNTRFFPPILKIPQVKDLPFHPPYSRYNNLHRLIPYTEVYTLSPGLSPEERDDTWKFNARIS